MKYIKKINPDDFEYYKENINSIEQKRLQLERNKKVTIVIFFLLIIINSIFFGENLYFFIILTFIYFGYMISILEKGMDLKLNKQYSENELLIKTIDILTKDKFFKERTDFINLYLMDIFTEFSKNNNNIYFDNEGENKTNDKFLSATEVKENIKNGLFEKYNNYCTKNIGSLYEFRDIFDKLNKLIQNKPKS